MLHNRQAPGRDFHKHFSSLRDVERIALLHLIALDYVLRKGTQSNW